MDKKNDPDSNSVINDLSYTDEESDVENRSNQSYKVFENGTKKSSITLNKELFEEFKQAVFKSRPNIANLYTEHGDKIFFDYAKSHIRENRNKIIKERRHEFNAVIYEYVRKTLGSVIAESVIKQLKTNDSISSVQHFSPLGHPDTLNAVLENALPYFDSNRPDLKNVIVAACAGVSFNNTKFPRGHLFHNDNNGKLELNQFTLLGHTVDARPVIHHDPYYSEGIKESKNNILSLERNGEINKEVAQKINKFIESIYNTPHSLSADDYVNQITITNYYIFKNLFQKYNKFRPNLIFLAQEKLVLELIIKNHISQKTVIHDFLFNSDFHSLIDKYFDGITGSFYNEKKLGTYLFWGLPKDSKYRIQLFREENHLVSLDGSFSVELSPEKIRQAIIEKELIPSVMLTFVILAMYYGIFLGGGYEQTYYLTQTKNAYEKLMKEVGDEESLNAIESLVTRNLVIPRPLLAYFEGNNDSRTPATGLDLTIYGDLGENWGKIIFASKNVKLGQIIERTLPSIYREYTKNNENDDIFSQITERDIEKFNGLDKIIPPLFKLL